MRVLHVIDGCAGMYGAETMLSNLVGEQIEIGVQPIVLSVSGIDEKIKPIEGEIRKKGVTVRRLTMSSRFSISDAKNILQCANSHCANIVHSHSYKTDILLGVLPKYYRMVPIISTVHGWLAIEKFSKLWLYMWINKLCLLRMDAVVLVSSARGILPINPQRRTFVVKNGISKLSFDFELNEFNSDEIAQFCADGYCVGAIGRLSPEKGLRYLIEAIEELRISGNECKAVIIGDGKQKLELAEMIKEKNLSKHIMLSGYIENASKYMPFFKVIVLPSLTEGLPVTILEAMQAEVPVVATRVGGIPEVLGNGLYGHLVEPKSAIDLAEKILIIKKNPLAAKEKAEAARKISLSKYSSRKMACEYLNVYNSVLNGWKKRQERIIIS
jgi:glycosyltransferase involved in cell wall biosynthesis